MATRSDVDLKIQAIVDGLENVSQLTSELGELEEAGSQQVQDNTQDLREGADDTSSVMEGLRDNIGKVVAAGAALGGVAAALRSSVDTFTDYDTRLRTINSVLETTGRSAQITGDEIREMAQDLARATLGSVEGFEDAATQVLAFKNVGTDSLGTVLELAQDMSQTFGGDVTNNARRLAMALDAPNESLTRLRRSGIQFSEDQEEVIESLVETGDTAAAQAKILEAVAGRVGGAARDAAEGLEGQFDTLSQQFEEFRRASGEAIEPALEAFLGSVTDALGWMSENTEVAVRAAQTLGVTLLAVTGPRLIGQLAATSANLATIGVRAATSAGAVRALGVAMRALPATAAVAAISGIAFGLLSWRDAARQAREEQAELHSETIRTATDFQLLQAQLDDTIISQENAGTAQEQLNRALEEGTVVVDDITGNYRRAGETLSDLIDEQQAAAQAQADLTRDELAGEVRDQAAAIVEQGQALAGLSRQFTEAAEKAKESTQSVEGLVGQLDLADETNISRVRQELDRVSRDSTIAADALRDQLIPELEAFPGLGEAGQQLLDDLRTAQAETRTLADDFANLDIDPEQYRSGLTTVERETVETFRRIATESEATSQQIADALTASLDQVGGDAVPRLQSALIEAFKAGRISAAQLGDAIQEAVTKVETIDGVRTLRDQLDTLASSGDLSASAFDELSGYLNTAERELRDAAPASQALADSMRDLAAATQEAIDSGDTLERMAAWRELVHTRGELNRALQDGTITAEEHAEAIEKLDEQMRELRTSTREDTDEIDDNTRAKRENTDVVEQNKDAKDRENEATQRLIGSVRQQGDTYAQTARESQAYAEAFRSAAGGAERAMGHLATRASAAGRRAVDDMRRLTDELERLERRSGSSARGVQALELQLVRLREGEAAAAEMRNQQELRNLRLEREKLQIEAERARLAGAEDETAAKLDAEAEMLSEQIRLQKELAEEEAKARKEREQERRREEREREEREREERDQSSVDEADAPDAPGSRPPTEEPSRTVRMDIDIGGTRGQFDVPAGQEDQVERLFRSLESQQSVST